MADSIEKITAINSVDDAPHLVVVRIGRRALKVRRVDIDPLHLHTGQTLSEQDAVHLEHAATIYKAWTAALKWLAKTPLTIATMRTKLGQRFGDNAAQSVVTALESAQLLDDVQAAESLRRRLERSGPIGPGKLATALARHNVHPDVAQDVLNDLSTGQDAVEAACQAATGMLRSLQRLDAPTRRRRLAGRLARRGFDAETVHETLERLGEGDTDARYDAYP
jgi:regulatory protein